MRNRNYIFTLLGLILLLLVGGLSFLSGRKYEQNYKPVVSPLAVPTIGPAALSELNKPSQYIFIRGPITSVDAKNQILTVKGDNGASDLISINSTTLLNNMLAQTKPGVINPLLKVGANIGVLSKKETGANSYSAMSIIFY